MFIIQVNGGHPFYLKTSELTPKKTMEINLAYRFKTIKKAQERIDSLVIYGGFGKGARFEIVPVDLEKQSNETPITKHLSNDEKIIVKYLSNKVSNHTKQALGKAFEEIRNQTRAEGWIKLTKRHLTHDLIGTDLLLVLNLSEFKVNPFVTTGRLFFSEKEVYYGNQTHRMGTGKLAGYFWLISETIYPLKFITHYQPKPSLPNE